MPMTDLSLGGLGFAVGANVNITSQTALAANGRGSTGTETKMSDFGITETDVSTTTANPFENQTILNFAFGTFQNAGSLFLSRIASRTTNFTWSESSNGSFFTLFTNSAYQANCSFGSVSSNTQCAVGYKFHDAYNVNATNYNSLRNSIFNIIDSGGGRSDIRWKQNIERVGTSQLGLPIFEFEYIDVTHGKGRFRGTIAQELIKNDYAHATYLDTDGYFWVDYNKIDIPLESC